ncbi:MAG: serine hydrolase [Saprospiraceae bacterium]|nr:serine hydrolase [Pyrinomonadaceae bacterium]
MFRSTRTILGLALIAILFTGVYAQKADKKTEILAEAGYQAPVFNYSAELQSVLTDSVNEMLAKQQYEGFKSADISATLIDLRDPKNLQIVNLAGEERIYPASVVKMFYMAALHRQLQDGKVKMTPELERGLKDMIVDSSNEATQYILDVLTGTSSGAELPQAEFDEWQFKRNRVNRYFTSMGYQNININQKTFCEDAYGIEQQSRGYKGQNRNMLTTNATARLLAEIALGKFVTPERSAMMMDLMRRDPFAETKDPEDQAHGFTGKALVDKKLVGTKLWSKAGWTSKTRHDAAYIETPNGLKFVLVVFTENNATKREPIPMIAGKIIDRLSAK